MTEEKRPTLKALAAILEQEVLALRTVPSGSVRS
jgi:hypothetical protein